MELYKRVESGRGTNSGAVTVVRIGTSLNSLVRHLEPSPVGDLDCLKSLYTWR